MTDFDDLFASVGVPALQGQFGETIIYHPRAGGSRTITVIHIDRNAPESLEDISKNLSPRIDIQVANDAATGISSAEINTGGDTVEVSIRKGGPVTTRSITKLLKDTGGVTHFLVR